MEVNQCGEIREIKITQMHNAFVATVEFMDRVSKYCDNTVVRSCMLFFQDSVPAALTKDKKRVHGEEVDVHLAWKSTLYVTNFPEKTDDSFIRSLFGKVGLLSHYGSQCDLYFDTSTALSLMYAGQARSSRVRDDSVMCSLLLP